ncbi:MAG: hypothetical protein AAF824_15955 [Bacteroidota bacterium]
MLIQVSELGLCIILVILLMFCVLKSKDYAFFPRSGTLLAPGRDTKKGIEKLSLLVEKDRSAEALTYLESLTQDDNCLKSISINKANLHRLDNDFTEDLLSKVGQTHQNDPLTKKLGQ